MDERQRARHGHPRQRDRRGGVRALSLGAEGGARRRRQDPQGPGARRTSGARRQLVEAVRDALYCSKICSYAQGFQLMREAQKEYKWKLELRRDRRDLARRLHHPRALPAEDHRGLRARPRSLVNLLLDPYFKKALDDGPGILARGRGARGAARHPRARLRQRAGLLRRLPHRRGSPPTCCRPSATYFGAHTYERVDQPRGKFFHLDWPDPKRPQHPV